MTGTSAHLFHSAATRAGFALDPSQAAAAGQLAAVLDARRGRRRRFPRARRTGGVYLWGPVGRGKTWLLDTFFEAAPSPGTRRAHFHTFFRDLHAGVHAHRRAAHPFETALADLLAGVDLLCFDELHVHDVGDAMFLLRLLRLLRARSITLVATSNYRPGELLPDPRFHHLFEPGIALIEETLAVVNVDGARDYRRCDVGRPGQGFRAGAFLQGPAAAAAETVPVPLAGARQIHALRAADGELTVSFGELCDSPVSATDYLRLAATFTRWRLTDVPPLRDQPAGVRQRFVDLVDVLHDADVGLTLVARQDFEETFAGDDLAADFARTSSRLRLLRREDATQTCEANCVR